MTQKFHINMKVQIPIALFFLLLLTACQNGSDGERVQEIRETAGGNADMIRNPISADQPLDTTKIARIAFEEEEFEFGEVNEGETVTHAFKFKNTGAVPLVISNCRSSCGCTVPTWPSEPIPPGGTGEIIAKFNTENKSENQRKKVYVTANTNPNETVVTLHGFVKPKKK